MKKKLLGVVLGASILVQSTGCGTVMFSHRHGQPPGRVDPNVVILDGIGLLFFIVPGLVAYAIDFASGAIYLPEDVERGEGPFIIDAPNPEASEGEPEADPDPDTDDESDGSGTADSMTTPD